VNEKSNNLIGLVITVLLIAVICAGIIYHYRGASGKLESELLKLERNNNELASETRQLQADVASHRTGITTIRNEVGKSRERIKHVYTEIEQAGNDVLRAIEIIEDCENIIETVKTQR